MREIVLDTETTGLDPAEGHRIIEIGCVELINYLPTGRVYHSYINPERDVPAEASAISGIKTEFLKPFPVFSKIVDEFLSFVGDDQLIIHNAAFDLKFLNAEFGRLNHPHFSGQSQQLRKSLIASRGKIVAFMYFILISCILIGSLMYVVEGKESGFTSIPISIYWCIVTLTIVGFGDITPMTPLGPFIASLVMIMGYGIIAVPTGIVTAEIAKSEYKRGLETKRHHCMGCGKDDHVEGAKFCDHCGNELDEHS